MGITIGINPLIVVRGPYLVGGFFFSGNVCPLKNHSTNDQIEDILGELDFFPAYFCERSPTRNLSACFIFVHHADSFCICCWQVLLPSEQTWPDPNHYSPLIFRLRDQSLTKSG